MKQRDSQLGRTSACTKCGHKFTDAFQAEGKKAPAPTAGSIMVCAMCGSLYVYETGGKVRAMNDTELLDCKPSVRDKVKAAQEAAWRRN